MCVCVCVCVRERERERERERYFVSQRNQYIWQIYGRDVIPCDMVTFCDKTCLPEILWLVMTFWEFCDKMWQSGQ